MEDPRDAAYATPLFYDDRVAALSYSVAATSRSCCLLAGKRGRRVRIYD
jgi:hypothetical protein